jgi:hypothetical protein
VLLAVVIDLDVLGAERGEPLIDEISRAQSGNTFLNGLTVTLANTPRVT